MAYSAYVPAWESDAQIQCISLSIDQAAERIYSWTVLRPLTWNFFLMVFTPTKPIKRSCLSHDTGSQMNFIYRYYLHHLQHNRYTCIQSWRQNRRTNSLVGNARGVEFVKWVTRLTMWVAECLSCPRLVLSLARTTWLQQLASVDTHHSENYAKTHVELGRPPGGQESHAASCRVRAVRCYVWWSVIAWSHSRVD